MTLAQWTAVDDYFAALFAPEDAVLKAALVASTAAGLPAHQVSAVQGKFLYLLARVQRAQRILEIGTLGGYSTLWLARALPPQGYLLSLELDPVNAEVARRNLAQASLAAQVEVRVGRAVDSLAQLIAQGEPPFDLIFIDADKPGNPDYLVAALQLARVGTLIIADNVVRDGAVIDPESADPNVQGVRRFAELAAADPRLSATALQTVGNKGYDGFALLLVGEHNP